MSKILKMPAEILCSILSRDHLPQRDLARAALVCKDFKEAASRSLYHTVRYGFNSHRAIIDDPHEQDSRKQQVLQSLLENIYYGKQYAPFVHELHLGELYPWESETFEPTPTNLSTDFSLWMLPNLRFLHVQDGYGRHLLCKDKPKMPPLQREKMVLPRLETILIRRYTAGLWRHFLDSPALRRIWLNESGDDLFDYRPALARPSIVTSHPTYRAVHGKELVINSTPILPGDIDDMVFGLQELESFIFVRQNRACCHDFRDVLQGNSPSGMCIATKIGDLFNSLFTVRKSLEKLALLWNNSFYCEFDTSVLQPLTEFTRLKNLRIDDTFLLGNHVACAQHQRLPRLPHRGPLDFAKLLPSSLERLDLHVPQESLRRNQNYCSELLDGLFGERRRLRSLTHITIEEMVTCRTKRCRECPADAPETIKQHNEPSGARDSNVSKGAIRKMQGECAKKNIRLDYIKRGSYRWKGRSHFAKAYLGDKPCSNPRYLYRHWTDEESANTLRASVWA